jgi:hypothetical protein
MTTKHVITALALTTALLSACNSDGGTGPFDKTSVTVNLCSEFIVPGVWIAVQNQGEGWTEITPDGSGVLTFDATEKVSVAFGFSSFGSTVTQVINTTAEQLQGTTGVACEEPEFGNASLSGTVTGLSGEQIVRLAAGPSVASALSSGASWTLGELPNVALDLVATRYATPTTLPADKVIVRRSVAPNSTGISLDFASAEARDFENAIVAFTNVPASSSMMLQMAFQTQNGTFQTLGTLTDFQAPFAFNYVTVPASLRVTTDLHLLDAFASSADASVGVLHAYKSPAAKTFAFGPQVVAPTTSQIATTPYLRLRAVLTRQSEYNSGVSVSFWQSTVGGNVKFIDITTTADFLDAGATTWDVAIPDFGSASGYDPAWGLTAGAEYFWSVAAFGGETSFALGGPPPDGGTVLYSVRSSGDIGTARVGHRPRVRPAR